MRVHLTADLQQRLLAHARSAAPREACGLLGGQRTGTALILDRYRPLPNRSRRPDAFRIDPSDIAHTFAEFHNQRRQLLATFHSHCAHAAVPSAADRAGAWPELLQLICPVYDEACGSLSAWSPELDWAAVPVTTSA